MLAAPEVGYPERFVQEQFGHAFASTTGPYTSVSNDFKNKTLQAALKRVYAPTPKSSDDHTDDDEVEPAPDDGQQGDLPTSELVPMLAERKTIL